MGYCGPVVDLDKFKEGFQRTFPEVRMTAGSLIREMVFLDFTDWPLWINTVRNAAFPIGWKLRGLQRRNLWI